jgi:Zn-finger nucleic acid-binding protein
LVGERYEEVAIDRCSSCQGAWLDQGEIVTIIDTRKEKFSQQEIEQTLKARTFRLPEKPMETHIPCPKCLTMMKTFNYGGDSGIILDKCKTDHGIWFDADELEKIQMFREHWEKASSGQNAQWEQLAQSVKRPGKQNAGLSPFKALVNLFFGD